jgi:uncharacterized protein
MNYSSRCVQTGLLMDCEKLEDKTTAQLVVVTVDDLGGRPLEEYATDLFREWGIGSAEKNNGVLLLLDIGGRQSRIEVGYDLEGILPDGKTGRIQDRYMVPHFQEGDYNEGILQGFEALISEVYTEYGYEYEGKGRYNPGLLEDYRDYEQPAGNIPEPIMILGIILVILLIILDFRFTGGIFTHMILCSFFRSRGN